ncbi:hypothetical protein J6590_088677 [Homalodisca vitripennis]|nr:hypothetical protein J6590_088677 [Homalodisca vitripennis]
MGLSRHFNNLEQYGRKQNIEIHGIEETRGENIEDLIRKMTDILGGLLWETKRFARETQYQFVWVRNGRIFARKHEKAQVHNIETYEDLHRFGSNTSEGQRSTSPPSQLSKEEEQQQTQNVLQHSQIEN